LICKKLQIVPAVFERRIITL